MCDEAHNDLQTLLEIVAQLTGVHEQVSQIVEQGVRFSWHEDKIMQSNGLQTKNSTNERGDFC